MSNLIVYNADTPLTMPKPGGRGTSYDLATTEGQRLAYRALVSSDFVLDNLIKEEIEVQHVVVHWIPSDNEDVPEHGLRLRAVLIAPDGTRVATGSLSAIRCVAEAAGLCCRVPPFDPPLRFRVVSEPRKGEPGHWLWLDWILGD